MALSLYGEQFYTAHFSGAPVWYKKVILPSDDQALKAVRLTVVRYGTPSLTSLELRIYSNRAGIPEKLLYTFDKTWTLSEISTHIGAAQEIWFDSAKAISLIGSETYHLVLWANGYVGTDTDHIAWIKDFPHPANIIGYTPTLENLSIAPFTGNLIGAEL